MLKSFINF